MLCSVSMKSHRKSEDENEYKLSVMLEHISEVIAIVDGCGFIKFQSKSIERILGYRIDETIESNFLSRAHPEDRKMLAGKLKDCTTRKGCTIIVKYRLMHKNGDWRNMEAIMQNMYDVPQINGILVHFKDNTELDVFRERANYFEFNDPLTGLPNKETFICRLQNEIDQADVMNKTFAVMTVDLKKFKYINDVYGFACGDMVIKKVGMKLKAVFREGDLVSRGGGAKFLVFLSCINSPMTSSALLKKTMEVFSSPLTVDGHTLRITAGMGICFYPQDGNTCEMLIKNSESAMYNEKKHLQTSYSLFNENQTKNMLAKIKLEQELQEAFYSKEFCIYYQPKVDKKGDIVGSEALVRWQSPRRGLVSPGLFIPIAESSELIVQLGQYVLHESCVQNKKWQEKGLSPKPVAVNISPVEFSRGDIIRDIKDVLKETGLEPSALELEITESGIIDNEEEAIEKLSELHNMNISISIDDFGTGYSSFSKLRDYPIDKLKIDKSFIDNLPDSKKSVILVRSMIGLAHNMGFKVISEGVETCKQFNYLLENGSDQFQGYYFYRPVGPEDLEKVLRKEIM